MKVPIDSLNLPLFEDAGVGLDLLRLDQIHPRISGNKWYKLKYALAEINASDCRRVLSFGGAWSNHIHALAWAARDSGLEAIAVIRGERPNDLSDTLMDAERWGMRLHFVSRQQYRDKYASSFLRQLRDHYGEFHLLPEGGSGSRVVEGCREIYQSIPSRQYDLIACACGTGGTLAGLIAACQGGERLVGVSALKGGGFLNSDIRRLLSEAGCDDPGGWEVRLDDHEGGYARISQALAVSLWQFHQQTGIELEPVYTGKVYLSLQRMLQAGELSRGSRVLMLHTGGLQGLRGMRAALQKHLNGVVY